MLKATASFATMILLTAGAFVATLLLMPRNIASPLFAGGAAAIIFFLACQAITQNVSDSTPPEEFRRFLAKLILVFSAPVPILFGLYLLLQPRGVFYFFFLLLAFFVFAGFIGTVVRAETSDDEPGRGARAISEERALSNSRRELVAENSLVRWAGIEISRAFTTSNFLYLGVTGSGKSLSLRSLEAQLLPSVKIEPNTRALIYDEKPDALPYLKTLGFDADTPECRVLNPFDKRTWVWDIARDASTPTKAGQIATLLIPLRDGQKEPFFTLGAQGLLAGAMTALRVIRGNDWDFFDLVLATQTKEILEELLLKTPQTVKYVRRFLEIRESGSILAELAAKTDRMEPLAAIWRKVSQRHPGKKLSLEEWAKGRFVLVLGNFEPGSEALKHLNSAMFSVAAQYLLAEDDISQRDPQSRRTYIILDEARKMKKLARLHDLITNGRSKGICFIIGIQGVEGWFEEYGRGEGDEILNQCANVAVFRCKSASAEWASRLIGEREQVIWVSGNSVGSSSSGASQTVSMSEQLRLSKLVLPSEIQNLPYANEVNGLHAYHVSPFAHGVYRRETSWSDVMSETMHADEHTLALELRDELDEEFLWEEADYERLGLTPPGRKAVPEPSGSVMDFQEKQREKAARKRRDGSWGRGLNAD